MSEWQMCYSPLFTLFNVQCKTVQMHLGWFRSKLFHKGSVLSWGVNIHYDVPVSRCIGREILVSINFFQQNIFQHRKNPVAWNLTNFKRKTFFHFRMLARDDWIFRNWIAWHFGWSPISNQYLLKKYIKSISKEEIYQINIRWRNISNCTFCLWKSKTESHQ